MKVYKKVFKNKLTSYIEDVILITVADLNNYFRKTFFEKQLTSKKRIDNILNVADEANKKNCSLKTKQSRKNVNVNFSYYM